MIKKIYSAAGDEELNVLAEKDGFYITDKIQSLGALCVKVNQVDNQEFGVYFTEKKACKEKMLSRVVTDIERSGKIKKRLEEEIDQL